MKKHRTHQIDELAQRVLQEALPSTWVLNKQEKDYAKDFLVEIGDESGELTGSSFFIQLKGTEKADLGTDKSAAKFYLESKYASYYLDKVKDLPVFLVLVDVTEKKAWWRFLQPVLDFDDKWRKQNSILIKFPVVNEVADSETFRESILEAKQWMRQRHPESIHDAVKAHKQRIRRIDPRFDVKVSLENDRPHFHLSPNQSVKLTLSGQDNVAKKLKILIDKGIEVAFLPGELKVTGSKLFEGIERDGCKIRASVDTPISVSLVCLDANQRELSRLSEIPGKCFGGQKELWFEGGLPNSPLSLKIGPIAAGVRGDVHVGISLADWNGQLLKSLAYFDRLHSFFEVVPKSLMTKAEFSRDGNVITFVEFPLQKLPFVSSMSAYLEALWKARKIADKFGVNPVWTDSSCDEETLGNVDQLYAIFFGNGWIQPKPNVQVKVDCDHKALKHSNLKQAKKLGHIRLESRCEYKLFSEQVDVGRLVHEYSDMVVKLAKEGRSLNGSQKNLNETDMRRILATGSDKTIMRVRSERQASNDDKSSLSVLSEFGKWQS